MPETTKIRLLPCWACGGDGATIYDDGGGGRMYVRCGRCHYGVGATSCTADGAARLWNRRPTPTLARLQAMVAAYNADPAHQRMQIVPLVSDAEMLDEIPAALPLEVSNG